MKKLLAVVWLAVWTVLPMSVALGTDTKAKGDDLMTAKGVVVAARSWDISAEVSNKINRLHFVQGQIVKKGDLLVEFDTAFKKLEVEAAEAARARAAAQMKLAQGVLERQEKLQKKQASSLAMYKEALFNAEIAKADHRSAEVKLNMAKAILSVQKLYAPFDGQISAPRYRENANVDITKGTEIATLVQLDPIHVRFSVPYKRIFARMVAGETDEKIAAKQRVVLTLPNGDKYEHEGKLISGGFGINSETGMQSVLAEFPNPKRVMRPGLKVVGTGYEK